ncbi:MAG: BON domain-containing protein [Desulfonatronovibrio sp.]|nr:BON domain-containing protein [Desulfovibrionales bacterium]
MKTFIIGILIGVIIGIGALWYITAGRETPEVQQTEERGADKAQEAKDSVMDVMEQTSQAFQAKMEAWELRPEDIRKDIEEHGEVVRRKAREVGETVSDAASDARITTTIKTRLAADSDLSAFSVSVSTTDGKVTLSGKVNSPEMVGKAVALALETEGVREVVSTLQVE